jgi:hypothetical protein
VTGAWQWRPIPRSRCDGSMPGTSCLRSSGPNSFLVMLMTKKEFTAGLIAITVGVALMMGGSMFSLVIVMGPKSPKAMLIPGIAQVGLGLFVVVGGILLWRGHAWAKYLLVVVGMGLVVNIGIFGAMAILHVSSNLDRHKPVSWSKEVCRIAISLA